MSTSEQVLRFGIIGCGAIAEQYYLPAFEQVQQAKVTHLVDMDESRGKAIADQFDVPSFTHTYEHLYNQVDGVIVATPPNSHIEISRACYEHGLHVLCEKPLAKSADEVERLMTMKKDNVHLAVGMVRRMNPSSRLMKQFVQSGQIGKVTGFKVEEGSEFNWPLQTPHLFSTNGFGGILVDTGTHIFDLLSWCFDASAIQIDLCRDDNWGGVESNVFVEAVMKTAIGDISGTIDLSFTRTLPNLITIYGERGKIEIPARGANEIKFYPSWNENEYLIIRSSMVDSGVRFNPFKAQIESFAKSILDNRIEYVTIGEALQTIRAIERCRAICQPAYYSWETKNLENRLGVK